MIKDHNNLSPPKNIQQLGLKIAHFWLPLLCPHENPPKFNNEPKEFFCTKEMDILNSFISNNRYLICN